MTKFTDQEIDQIKSIQQKYNVLGIQLLQIKLAWRELSTRQQSLKQEELALEEQVYKLNVEERDLAKTLDKKYGIGSLDLETGEFTPKVESLG